MVQLLVDQSWLEILQGELQKQYIDKLAQFVCQEVAGKYPIYPPAAKVFNAFNTCPLNNVKVVILGQVGCQFILAMLGKVLCIYVQAFCL